ncbi:MAG: alpha-glucan phosphorylase, partial [Treponema sp.]|nr:alpha-glucan phosphorylase [Treponema sp.]
FYLPALKNYRRIIKDDYAEAKSLAAYFNRLSQAWDGLRIMKTESNFRPVMQRGDSLTVTAFVDLGILSPEELKVELYHGSVSNQGSHIENARCVEMKHIGHEENVNLFQVKVECEDTGMQGHTVRILPKHEALVHPYRSGLIKWA